MIGGECKIDCRIEGTGVSDLQCDLVCDDQSQQSVDASKDNANALSEFVEVTLNVLGISTGTSLQTSLLKLFSSSKANDDQGTDSWSAHLMGNVVGASSMPNMPSASLSAKLSALAIVIASPFAIFDFLRTPRSPEQEADERIRQRSVEKMYSIMHLDETISRLGVKGYDGLLHNDRINSLSAFETKVDLGIKGMNITVIEREGKIKISYKGGGSVTIKEADLLSGDSARQHKAIQKVTKAKWFQTELNDIEKKALQHALEEGDLKAVERAAQGISVSVDRPRPKVVIEDKMIHEGVRQMIEEGKPIQVLFRVKVSEQDEEELRKARDALDEQAADLWLALEEMDEAQSFIERRTDINVQNLAEMVLVRYKLMSYAKREELSEKYGTDIREVPLDWARELLKTDELLHDDIIDIERLQRLLLLHGQFDGMASYDAFSYEMKVKLLSTVDRRYNSQLLTSENHMMLYKLDGMKSVESFLQRNPHVAFRDLANDMVALWKLMPETERERIKKQFPAQKFNVPEWVERYTKLPETIAVDESIKKDINNYAAAIKEMESIPNGWIAHVLDHPGEFIPEGRVIDIANLILIDEQLRAMGWNTDGLSPRDHINELNKIVEHATEKRANDLTNMIMSDGRVASMEWRSNGLSMYERLRELREIVSDATGGQVNELGTMFVLDWRLKPMERNTGDLSSSERLDKFREIVKDEMKRRTLNDRNIRFDVDPQEYALRQRKVEIDFNTRAMSRKIRALRTRYDAVYSRVAQMPYVLERAKEYGVDAHGVTRIIIMYEHFIGSEVKPEWVQSLVENPMFRAMDPFVAERAAIAEKVAADAQAEESAKAAAEAEAQAEAARVAEEEAARVAQAEAARVAEEEAARAKAEAERIAEQESDKGKDDRTNIDAASAWTAAAAEAQAEAARVAEEEAAKAKAEAAKRAAEQKAEAARVARLGTADTELDSLGRADTELGSSQDVTAEPEAVIDIEDEPTVDMEDKEEAKPVSVPDEVREEAAVSEQPVAGEDAQKANREQRVDDAQRAEARPSVERQQVEAKPAEKPAEKPKIGDTLPTGMAPQPGQLERIREASGKPTMLATPSAIREAADSKPPSSPTVSLPPPKSPPRRRPKLTMPATPRAMRGSAESRVPSSPPVSLPPPISPPTDSIVRRFAAPPLPSEPPVDRTIEMSTEEFLNAGMPQTNGESSGVRNILLDQNVPELTIEELTAQCILDGLERAEEERRALLEAERRSARSAPPVPSTPPPAVGSGELDSTTIIARRGAPPLPSTPSAVGSGELGSSTIIALRGAPPLPSIPPVVSSYEVGSSTIIAIRRAPPLPGSIPTSTSQMRSRRSDSEDRPESQKRADRPQSSRQSNRETSSKRTHESRRAEERAERRAAGGKGSSH